MHQPERRLGGRGCVTDAGRWQSDALRVKYGMLTAAVYGA